MKRMLPYVLILCVALCYVPFAYAGQEADTDSDNALDAETGGTGNTSFTAGEILYCATSTDAGSPGTGVVDGLPDMSYDTDHIEIADDKDVCWGAGSDFCVRYDEATDDRVEFSAGFYVNGGVTATSFSTGGSATPSFTLTDTSEEAAAGSFNLNSSGAYDAVLNLGVEDSTGEGTPYFQLDGVNETVDFLKDATFVANSITSADIATIVESIVWVEGGLVADGTQCANPAKVTINSGPVVYSVICADNDASSIYGHVVMPDSWDAGTVTFELEYLQTAADTNVLNSDIACQCHAAGETINSTYGSEVAIDDAAVTGSNAIDHTASAAVTCAGTCAAGDSLYWRWQLDATGTTTAVATLHILGMKMEYTSNVGD